MGTQKQIGIFVSALVMTAVLALGLGVKENAEIPEKPSDTVLDFRIIENVEPVDRTNYDSPYGMFVGEAYWGKL